ncbi:hypothetical protein MRX96_030927 [Rhipicephalus microplus]
MCAPSPVAVRGMFSRFQGGEKRHSFARLLQRPSFLREQGKERNKNHAPSSNCDASSANWVIMLPEWPATYGPLFAARSSASRGARTAETRVPAGPR